MNEETIEKLVTQIADWLYAIGGLTLIILGIQHQDLWQGIFGIYLSIDGMGSILKRVYPGSEATK